MKRRTNYLIPFILTIGFLFQQRSMAQSYDIPNDVVGNGGDRITSSSYVLTSTIRQPIAGIGLRSGQFLEAIPVKIPEEVITDTFCTKDSSWKEYQPE